MLDVKNIFAVLYVSLLALQPLINSSFWHRLSTIDAIQQFRVSAHPYCKCTTDFEFINGCKANKDTHKKQQKYSWHPTSRGHIILLLIYAIRPWPYMRITAWSQWIAISQNRLEYIPKHMALCSILQHYQAYVKGLFRSRHKTLKQSTSIVGLARQNWFENYCWCLTTVYSHSRSCGTMTQSNRVDSADYIQLTSVLQCCVTMKVGIRAL